MTIHRVKVTFKDEPGEGSGVARSYYTAVGEAFLSGEKLPALDNSRSKAGFGLQYRYSLITDPILPDNVLRTFPRSSGCYSAGSAKRT